MSAAGFCLLVLSAVTTMAANLLLRAGIVRTERLADGDQTRALMGLVRPFLDPVFAAGFLLYFAAALIWFRVIAQEPLSVAYPVLVGLTFTLVSIGAVLAFREPMSLQRAIGLAVILGGIAIASTSSAAPAP